MPEPPESADPQRVGPFRLTARARVSDAGIVFDGADTAGRPVSVAVLTRAAAADAAARERFVAAIVAGKAGVVEADLAGAAPWVAVTADDAGRFLDAVVLTGGGRARGPAFRPHWAGGPAESSIGRQARRRRWWRWASLVGLLFWRSR